MIELAKVADADDLSLTMLLRLHILFTYIFIYTRGHKKIKYSRLLYRSKLL